MLAANEYAYDLGRFNTYCSYLTAYGNEPSSKASAIFHRHFRNPVENLTYSKSAATYVAQIDRFYKTFPSKLTLNVESVLRCLCDKPMYSCNVVGEFKYGLLPWPTGP